jgi:hypothetical protein
MVAASAGFGKACAMLIENGANIYSIDQNGNNPHPKSLIFNSFIQVFPSYIMQSIVKTSKQLL